MTLTLYHDPNLQAQAELAQRVTSLPAAPGSLTASAALAAAGAMAWVSPLQVRLLPAHPGTSTMPV